MSVAALIAWVLTAALGLYMFTTWLIEDDGSTGRQGYWRLRAPVMFSHAGLALSGLAVWLLYVYVDSRRLAWAALIILVAVAALGLIMFTRWIPVHRLDAERAAVPRGRTARGWAADSRAARGRAAGELAPGGRAQHGPVQRGLAPGGLAPGGLAPGGLAPGGLAPGGLAAPLPAERSFPALVVVLHGACALVTIGLVLLVAFGLGG
jgi:hypothetical protein